MCSKLSAQGAKYCLITGQFVLKSNFSKRCISWTIAPFSKLFRILARLWIMKSPFSGLMSPQKRILFQKIFWSDHYFWRRHDAAGGVYTPPYGKRLMIEKLCDSANVDVSYNQWPGPRCVITRPSLEFFLKSIFFWKRLLWKLEGYDVVV